MPHAKTMHTNMHILLIRITRYTRSGVCQTEWTYQYARVDKNRDTRKVPVEVQMGILVCKRYRQEPEMILGS